MSGTHEKGRILLSVECSNNVFVNWFLIQASENNTLIKKKALHSLQEQVYNIWQKMRLPILLQKL